MLSVEKLNFYACVCTYVCIYSCVYLCMWRLEVNLRSCIYSLSLAWSSPHLLGWLTTSLKAPSVSPSLVLGLQVCTTMPDFLHGFW